MDTVVKLHRVFKEYRRGGRVVHALEDVTFECRVGGLYAFMGPSGSGKSTLLNLVAGLDWPTAGEIIIDGRATAMLTDREWTRLRREHIGMVFQAFHLIPGLSAEENVALPLLLRGESTRSGAPRVTECLEWVGLGKRRHHKPAELSGGEQQRVALARALVHNPRLILADEPTGNLDSRSGGEVIALLKRLARDFGHTVLLATHSETAGREADHIRWVRDGRVIEQPPQRIEDEARQSEPSPSWTCQSP